MAMRCVICNLPYDEAPSDMVGASPQPLVLHLTNAAIEKHAAMSDEERAEMIRRNVARSLLTRKPRRHSHTWQASAACSCSHCEAQREALPLTQEPAINFLLTRSGQLMQASTPVVEAENVQTLPRGCTCMIETRRLALDTVERVVTTWMEKRHRFTAYAIVNSAMALHFKMSAAAVEEYLLDRYQHGLMAGYYARYVELPIPTHMKVGTGKIATTTIREFCPRKPGLGKRALAKED